MQCKKCKKECLDEELTNGFCASCVDNANNVNHHDSLPNSSSNYLEFKIRFIVFIILFAGIIAFVIFFNSLGNNSKTTSSSSKPDDIELMSYAQTVLEDNLNNPKFSHYKGDYTFVNTNLRYKIEGNVTIDNSKEKFYMVIEFIDDSYKEYDLISLQVGNKTIYKKRITYYRFCEQHIMLIILL